ncbi:MAG TPA: PilZ domain-containing protein [Terriglobales bacterium]|jgi:CheY-like chemotaxis protein
MIISRDWQEVSVLECILSGLHIDVDVESEIEAAWGRLHKSKVDAVIVDCDTPGSRNFLRRIQRALPGPAPVIIASGTRSQEGMRATGATFVVEKPVSVEQAVRTLSAARNLILNERLRYYREPLDLPVWITRQTGRRLKCRVVNVSKGGTKVVSGKPLDFSEDVSLNFALPRTRTSLQALGKVAWADKHGNAGIRFLQIEHALQRKLELWVEQRYFEAGP